MDKQTKFHFATKTDRLAAPYNNVIQIGKKKNKCGTVMTQKISAPSPALCQHISPCPSPLSEHMHIWTQISKYVGFIAKLETEMHMCNSADQAV